MMDWMKGLDRERIVSQINDLKDEVQDIRFRKPWSRGSDSSSLLYIALGAGLAWGAAALFKNRKEVAQFCAQCGSKIKDSWEHGSMKDKAGRMMGKAKDGAREAMASDSRPSANGQEPLY